MIDEDSEAVVRRIFDMTLQGYGSTAIARLLNSEGILTPGAYFRQKNPGSGRFRKASEKNGWTAASVLNILHQYEYTGALVGHKRYKANDCPKGKLFTEKGIKDIVFQAVMQILAICQKQRKQKSSLMLTRKERIAACVAELQRLDQVYLWAGALFQTKIDSHIAENRLAATGVYALVRNPIYSAFMFFCTGTLMIAGNTSLP